MRLPWSFKKKDFELKEKRKQLEIDYEVSINEKA